MSALVGVGVVGAAAAALATLHGNSLKSQKHVELRDELLDIKRLIQQRIDCEKTLNPVADLAKCSGTIDVLDKKGDVLISKDGRKIGRWTVRTDCTSTGLVFKAARPKAGIATPVDDNDFAADPLTGRQLSFANDNGKRLFKIDEIPCGERFSMPSPSPGGNFSFEGVHFFGSLEAHFDGVFPGSITVKPRHGLTEESYRFCTMRSIGGTCKAVPRADGRWVLHGLHSDCAFVCIK